MNNKKYISLLAISLVAVSLAMALPAFAQTNQPGAQNGGRFGRGMMGNKQQGVAGTVTAISGNALTITVGQGFDKNDNNTNVAKVYTVDASGATVTKNGATSTVSAIVVGDKVMVQGTVTGTNVVAKTIRDGQGPKGVPQTSVIQGNGQPIVAGKITVINGNTVTIANNSNVTYTIDASNAKIVVKNTASTISSLAVGDNVVVQGTVNGSAVVASSVIDQKPKTNNGFMGGMMDGIGNFFKHMFGF